jgi:hypothetical protein
LALAKLALAAVPSRLTLSPATRPLRLADPLRLAVVGAVIDFVGAR